MMLKAVSGYDIMGKIYRTGRNRRGKGGGKLRKLTAWILLLFLCLLQISASFSEDVQPEETAVFRMINSEKRQ